MITPECPMCQARMALREDQVPEVVAIGEDKIGVLLQFACPSVCGAWASVKSIPAIWHADHEARYLDRERVSP